MPAAKSKRAFEAYARMKAKAPHARKALLEGIMLKICPNMERLRTKQAKATMPISFEK